jgi:hypothetical protein
VKTAVAVLPEAGAALQSVAPKSWRTTMGQP